MLSFYAVFDLTKYSKDPFIIGFAYIVLGLFFGFCFQAITSVLRKPPFEWNNHAFKNVQHDNNYRFEKIVNLFPTDEQKMLREEHGRPVFFLMDTILRGERSTFLPTHFSSLFTFWSNLLLVTIIVFVVAITRTLFNIYISREQYLMLVFLPVLGGISFLFANKFLKSFYDTILNVFYGKIIAKKFDVNS